MDQAVSDNNANKYFRFSDNGRIFMITDVDSSTLSDDVKKSFNNASKFFSILTSALKQANKTLFDYLEVMKILNGRKETIFNYRDVKNISYDDHNYNKLNEEIIKFVTNGLPVKDSNLTVAKNVLSSIKQAMYQSYVVNKLDEKIAYPILYLESYSGMAIMSFKVYSITSSQIKGMIYYQDGQPVLMDCEKMAYASKFQYEVDNFDYINIKSN
jgi:hypothetical protein